MTSTAAILIMFICGILGAEQQPYDVIPYDSSVGMYFQNLGDIRLYNDIWTLITYVDIKHHYDNVKLLRKYYDHTVNLCSEPENKIGVNIVCDSVKKIASILIENIEGKNKMLFEIIGYDTETRKKRSLFGIVGKISKFLFGTMDESDATYYNDKITKFSKDELELIHLIKDQSSIVKSTIHNFNATISSLDHNERVLSENMLKLQKLFIDKLGGIDYLKFHVELMEHVSILNMLLEQQLEVIDALISAVLFAEKGQLHPALLSPSRLVTELQQVSAHLPMNTDFPMSINVNNIQSLLKCVDMNVYHKDGYLVFVLNIPLVDNIFYDIYQMYALPIHIQYNKYIFIQPSNKYLAIDKIKHHYFMISEVEFLSCKMYYSKRFICKQRQPILITHQHEVCEVKLFQLVSEIPESCDKRIIHLENSIWTQIINSNEWIFVLPQRESITISCKTERNLIDLKLNGTGKFTLNEGCKAYSKDTMLITHKVYSSKIYYGFAPKLEIELDCCEKLREKSVNLSNIIFNKGYKLTTLDLNDLNIASHKLSDIENMANEMEKNINTEQNITYYSVAVYVIVVIMFLVLINCCCKNCCKRTVCGCASGICIKLIQNVRSKSPRRNTVVRYDATSQAVLPSVSDDNSYERECSSQEDPVEMRGLPMHTIPKIVGRRNSRI